MLISLHVDHFKKPYFEMVFRIFFFFSFNEREDLYSSLFYQKQSHNLIMCDVFSVHGSINLPKLAFNIF